MKTLSKLSILLLVLASMALSSCALGGNIFRENDGFGSSNNNVQQNPLALTNTETTMN